VWGAEPPVLYISQFRCIPETLFTTTPLDLTKKTRRSSELIGLQPLHSKPLILSKDKLNDLGSLLPSNKIIYHFFYNAIMFNVDSLSFFCLDWLCHYKAVTLFLDWFFECLFQYRYVVINYYYQIMKLNPNMVELTDMDNLCLTLNIVE